MGKTISVASFEDMAKAAQKLQSLSETYTDIYTQLMQEANTCLLYTSDAADD